MKAFMLLADWAEALNGKLYIQGGGWTRYTLSQPGVLNCAVAVKFSVGWDETNKKYAIAIRLIDDNGHPVMADTRPVVVETGMEVGRPAGSTPGADLDAVLAITIVGLPIERGRYEFVIEVDGDPLGVNVPFEVV
jgi:hypothetical protein